MLPNRPASVVYLALGVIALSGACSSADGGDRDALLAAILPHVERFEAFDAWARRTVLAEPAAPASASFAATLFAPLRGDDAVVDAWVVREGTSPRRWTMRAGVFDAPLTDVRAPRLGSIRAALGVAQAPTASREVIVIERTNEETASTKIVVAVVCVVVR